MRYTNTVASGCSDAQFTISPTFKKIAAKSGIKVSQAMKDTKKAEIYSSLGGADKIGQALVSAQMAPADFDLYIEAVLISDQLSKKAMAAGVAEADIGTAVQQLVLELTKTEKVKINPQFGYWNPTGADLVSFDSAGTAVKVKTA